MWFNEKAFSNEAREVLVAAGQLASSMTPDSAEAVVTAAHVACVLFCDHPIKDLCLASLSSNEVAGLQNDLRDHVAKANIADTAGQTDLFLRCTKAQRPSFGPKAIEDILLALWEPTFCLKPIFEQRGLTVDTLREALPSAFHGAVAHTEGQGANKFLLAPLHQASKKSEQAVASTLTTEAPRKRSADNGQVSVMASFGVDMVAQARSGRLDPVVGRGNEIDRVLQVLSRRTKNNVCLIGQPGVGKTAVAEAVAQRIAEGSVPEQLKGCRELWSLDMGALLAGTGLRGDFEERLRMVLLEIRNARGAILLFIDELHLVLGAGRSESNNVDAANLMKPMLARGEIRCIGATTTEEYQKLILAKDGAFERRFQPLELKEPTLPVAIKMLGALVPLYAFHHGVEVSSGVVDYIVRQSHKKIVGRSLPDKAIDVLDEACCFAATKGDKRVTQCHVEAVLQRWRAPPWQRKTSSSRLLDWMRDRLSRL